MQPSSWGVGDTSGTRHTSPVSSKEKMKVSKLGYNVSPRPPYRWGICLTMPYSWPRVPRFARTLPLPFLSAKNPRGCTLTFWGVRGTISMRNQRLRRSPALRRPPAATPKGTAGKIRGRSKPQRAIIDNLATRNDPVIPVPHQGPAWLVLAGRGMKNTRN